MKVKELITRLQKYDQNAHIYLNCEKNIEDEFFIVWADDDNLLLVPKYKYNELRYSQDISFLE